MFQSTQKSFLNYFRGWDAPNIVNECINTIHKSNKYHYCHPTSEGKILKTFYFKKRNPQTISRFKTKYDVLPNYTLFNDNKL